MVLWRHSECLLRSVWRLLTVAIAEMVMRMSATVLGFVFGGVAKRRKAEEDVVSVVSTCIPIAGAYISTTLLLKQPGGMAVDLQSSGRHHLVGCDVSVLCDSGVRTF